jgi:acyl carrier protein
MNRPELITIFQRMASEVAEKDFSHVTEDAAIADLGIDSLGMLELVASMERELSVSVPDEQLVGIQTVRQLLDLVERRVAAK